MSARPPHERGSDLATDFASAIATIDVPVVVLPRALGAWWLDRFMSIHADPVEGTWLWEGLRPPFSWIEYGETDGLNQIGKAISEWGPSVLLATDETDPPAATLLGQPHDLVRIVREVRHFEFLVLDASAQRYVFDTHLNAYAVGGLSSGDIPGH
jgi:hypothetical protein